MDLLAHPLATVELLVIDTETNGLGGDQCELTEVGAVLVGGGELHDRWSSLVRTAAPLRRGIQRFTGISQAMVDGAPEPEPVLRELERRLEGKVFVAHSAAFDRRVLRQAFDRCGLQWPNPPVVCTAALARALLPLQRVRRLTALADALGIEVEIAHRALPDAETCARVLCALFPRLCANAATVADAVALLAPRRPRRPARPRGLAAAPARAPDVDFAKLPRDPGVYLFRDARGATLYVGKSVSIRTRARAHFAPAAGDAEWTAHAAIVDYRATQSELGALVLENRLIKELGPPGNVRLTRRDDRLVYLRCRLDIPFPILEVAREPAAGHAVTIGPLRGRRLVLELAEQLDSLFGLRHCGRRLPRRQYPSAYGQMGRCLSPCLGDLDPNLYRSRLDAALSLFIGDAGGGRRLLAYVEAQMRSAAAERRYERAAWLRRRLRRLEAVLGRLGGVLQATHAQPRLVLAGHPTSEARFDAFWLVGGRVADWGAVTGVGAPGVSGARGVSGAPGVSGASGESGAPGATDALGATDDLDALAARTTAALSRLGGHRGVGTHVPPDEVDEVRIVGNWLASHPETPTLVLNPAPDRRALAEFVAGAAREAPDLQAAGAERP